MKTVCLFAPVAIGTIPFYYKDGCHLSTIKGRLLR